MKTRKCKGRELPSVSLDMANIFSSESVTHKDTSDSEKKLSDNDGSNEKNQE